MLPAHGNIISTMVSLGIKSTKSYSFLSEELLLLLLLLLLLFFGETLSTELGGANNVLFSRRDCHNFVQTKRKEIMEVGDG